MRTNQDYLTLLINALIEDGRLTGEGIQLDGVSLKPEYDQYGFYPITSEYGGRENFYYNLEIDKWLNSGDPLKVKVAEKAPRLIVVNYKLTPEQIDPDYRFNHNKYFIGNFDTKTYSKDSGGGVAANIVFDFYKQDPENKKKGILVKDHLVACAGDNAWPTSKHYEWYLSSVAGSAIKRLWTEYDLLVSASTRKTR